MATRSFIGYEVDKKCKMVYCHNDGYPEYNGKILLEHYNDLESVKELIKKGDFSSLARDKNEIKYYSEQGEDIKILEDGYEIRPKKWNTIKNMIEYVYIYRKGLGWYIGSKHDKRFKYFIPLKAHYCEYFDEGCE